MKLTLTLLIASTVAVQAAPYVSGDGHEYDLTCSADGYSLKSRYPVARIVGSGVGSRPVTGIETLALGRSCDAYTKINGYGQWCWANGGFRAEFPNGSTIGFPRQELSCPVTPEYELNCRC